MRIGTGYDVHRLETGVPLILGGVKIPYEKGLTGHSDADVLLHAVMDALLGAAGLPDIGVQFPDTDEETLGISSLVLLSCVKDLIGEAHYKVENIDATLLMQEPHILPYKEEMRKNIADTLKIDIGRVSIKATTEEGMGFTGRGEGIAAQAVCLLSEDN